MNELTLTVSKLHVIDLEGHVCALNLKRFRKKGCCLFQAFSLHFVRIQRKTIMNKSFVPPRFEPASS
jgi:hypothetical protein